MYRYWFRTLIVAFALVFMSGCVGYVSPYAQYPAPISVPYAAPPPVYSYRLYPVVPLPLLHFGYYRWWHGGHGHYRHHRHH